MERGNEIFVFMHLQPLNLKPYVHHIFLRIHHILNNK